MGGLVQRENGWGLTLYTAFEGIQVEITTSGERWWWSSPWAGGDNRSRKNEWVYLKINSWAKRRWERTEFWASTLRPQKKSHQNCKGSNRAAEGERRDFQEESQWGNCKREGSSSCFLLTIIRKLSLGLVSQRVCEGCSFSAWGCRELGIQNPWRRRMVQESILGRILTMMEGRDHTMWPVLWRDSRLAIPKLKTPIKNTFFSVE